LGLAIGHVPGEYGGIYYPVVLCDACGERIEALSQGNYYWSDEQACLGFSHKSCSRVYEAAFGRLNRAERQTTERPELPPAICFDELKRLPLRLWLNGGFTPTELANLAGAVQDEDLAGAHPCERCGKGRIGTCARCGKKDVVVERHHFAPRSRFKDPDAWPTCLLCEGCHDEWHQVMGPTPGRKMTNPATIIVAENGGLDTASSLTPYAATCADSESNREPTD
jgi:hypothetical protein